MQTAQIAMRRAHVNGAPGVLVSGFVWLAAGLAASRADVATAFAVLFFGGMLIVPLAALIARKGFGQPKPAPGQPLERLGLEMSFVLFAGILVAFTLLARLPGAVFPALITIIGARYFAFRTIYGEPLYWLLAGVLVLLGGVTLLLVPADPAKAPLIAGVIEIVLAAALVWRLRQTASDPVSGVDAR